MAEPINVTDDSFLAEVVESDMPVLVDFWAEWCGPCRMIAPSVKQIAAEYGEAVKVVKVDIDENPVAPAHFGILSIPTLMLFKNGMVVARITGAMPKDRLLAQILPHLELKQA
jgi:thioredoxin 1